MVQLSFFGCVPSAIVCLISESTSSSEGMESFSTDDIWQEQSLPRSSVTTSLSILKIRSSHIPAPSLWFNLDMAGETWVWHANRSCFKRLWSPALTRIFRTLFSENIVPPIWKTVTLKHTIFQYAHSYVKRWVCLSNVLLVNL